ncbi:MAG: tetratricopeptide repeat protein [Gemmataceae bacterium]|nr:tetratricopeptide repeat protein [Gemmataceae bacterium]
MMHASNALRICWLTILGALAGHLPVRAGVYYSGETFAELPSQWRGFLVDQRQLRVLAGRPPAGLPDSPLRAEYEREWGRLRANPSLSADEAADLGALCLRLGKFEQALDVLRPAQRQHPTHFRIAANLGTAWHLHGELDRAVDALKVAVRLAPESDRPYEQLHLRLVEGRRRAGSGIRLDDLFGVRYGDHVGTMPDEERQKLPADAVAMTQRLALSLPADGLLLWQLGELANAHGDIASAAAILEGCVSEFGLNSPELRRRRQQLREAADRLGPPRRGDSTLHEEHTGFRFRSTRPLARKLDVSQLPQPRADRPTPLPWTVLAETKLDAFAKPTFLEYLKQLDGKSVSLTGFMVPLSEQYEVGHFLLLEYPIGCWFCEVPPPTALLLVELPEGKSESIRRGLIKVTGRLKLNATDPEDFLYSVQDAVVSEVD